METRTGVNENYLDSSSCDSDSSEYYPDEKRIKLEQNSISFQNEQNNMEDNSHTRLPTRQPKCFTKNAVMARQNRLKKKKYVQDLEFQVTKLRHENKSLSSILDNQSSIIKKLRNEVKYIRSVLANSKDISKLLKTINYNTGMSVSTSLDKSLTLTSNCFSKSEHPWEGMNIDDSFAASHMSNTDFGLLFGDSELCLNPIEETISPNKINHNIFPEEKVSDIALKEHNYTINTFQDEDVGICLHVSKHRVSLEFCSICSDNALENWSNID